VPLQPDPAAVFSTEDLLMSLYEALNTSRLAQPEVSSTGVVLWRAGTALLFMAALAYATAAALTLSHRLSWIETSSVFSAGAAPGLTVTLLLWLARPCFYSQRIRKRLVFVSLAGATSVAVGPMLLAGF